MQYNVQFQEQTNNPSQGIDNSFHDHQEIPTTALIVFFLFIGLAVAGLVREVNKKTGVPYTPMLFIIGIFVGKFASELGLIGESVSTIQNIDPHGILMIFLPILVFESGFNSDWHYFKKQSGQIFILAFPCVVFSAFFLLISLKIVLGYDNNYYTWSGAFMFGSILSCTDTVAVLSLLKEVGAPKKFNSLIEGESLLNDGSCMVLFEIASDIVKGQEMTILEVIKLFFSLTIGGTALGILFGIIATIWLKKTGGDEILSVNVTFFTCFILYFVSENVDLGFRISGIMALVSLGLFMSIFGKTQISKEAEHTVHIFWKYVVYVAESTIFLLSGVLVGVKVLNSKNENVSKSDYFKLLGLYVCMILSRFGSIAIFMKWLKKWGYGLTWAEVYVLTYGGLRGAVGIAFAMIVANDKEYAQQLKDIILFDMAGNAFLTLIINATTTGPLIKNLGLCQISTVRQRVFLNFLEDFKTSIEQNIEDLKNNSLHKENVSWKGVSMLVGIDEIQKQIKICEEELKSTEKEYYIIKRLRNISPIEMEIIRQRELRKEYKLQNKEQQDVSDSDSDSNSSENEDYEEQIVECRNRFLMVLKFTYWNLFEDRQCSGDALRLLVDSVNWDIDQQQERMNSWEFLQGNFHNPLYINFLFFLKSFPIFGSLVSNILFNHISNIYDVVLSYIEAHEIAEQECTKFHMQKKVKNYIQRESEDNRKCGEEYIKHYLNISFPEIQVQLQTKKAAYTILEDQKKFVNQREKVGQLDEREKEDINKIIQSKINIIDDMRPNWQAPSPMLFIMNIPFFKQIPEVILENIIQETTEMIFERDQYIIKEGDTAKYLFVILRGSCTETSQFSQHTFSDKKGVASIVSVHNIIYPSARYTTSCVADAMVYTLAFNLYRIQKLTQRLRQLEEFVWKESLHTLSRLKYQNLKPIGKFSKDAIQQATQQMQFKKFKKGTMVTMESGGIFLKGKIINNIQGIETPRLYRPINFFEEEVGEHSESNSTKNKIQEFTEIQLFRPGTVSKVVCQKNSCFFLFQNFDQIDSLILNEDLLLNAQKCILNKQQKMSINNNQSPSSDKLDSKKSIIRKSLQQQSINSSFLFKYRPSRRSQQLHSPEIKSSKNLSQYNIDQNKNQNLDQALANLNQVLILIDQEEKSERQNKNSIQEEYEDEEDKDQQNQINKKQYLNYNKQSEFQLQQQQYDMKNQQYDLEQQFQEDDYIKEQDNDNSNNL